jgi:hypothetical protein
MKRFTPIAVALLVLAAGCSSSDPTASDEYAAVEQELTQTEAELAEVTAERDAFAVEVVADAAVLEEAIAAVAPEKLAALVDDWHEANSRGDGSVLDLYVPEGYHLYGATRIEYEDIPSHLSSGTYEHEWITGPMVITDEGDGRYVVVRGMRIANSGGSNASAVLFEIVRTVDDELLLAQTSWFYDNEGGSA